MLTTGGHNVGIVNPPTGPVAHENASYRIAHYARGRASSDPAAFLTGTAATPGSWWPAWTHWLASHSSGSVPARDLRSLDVGDSRVAAPGVYVHQQ